MTVTGAVDSARLRSFIERIERLEVEKAALAADIRDVYAELKSAGYDVKTTRAVIKLRKMESDAREEQEQLLDLYKHALGMLADLPLGEAAIEREVSPVRRAVRKVQAARPATPHDPTTGEVLGDAPAPASTAIATVRIGDGPEVSLEEFKAAAQSVGTPEGRAAVEAARDPVTGIAPPTAALGAIIKARHPEPEPATPDPDLSPLIADAAARQAAARKLLGQAEAAE